MVREYLFQIVPFFFDFIWGPNGSSQWAGLLSYLSPYFFIPSPTKLRRDIVTLPSVRSSFRNILVNTLESTSFKEFWPNLVHTYSLRESGTLLIFKVIGQRSRSPVKFLGEGMRHALRCPCFLFICNYISVLLNLWWYIFFPIPSVLRQSPLY